MSMNLIVEGKRYNPNRDIAHNFHYLLEDAAKFAAQPLSPSLAAYAASEGVTPEHLGQAVKCLFEYVNGCLDPEHQTPQTILQASGFFALPVAAQTIVLSKLGIVIACTYFHGIRDATMVGEPPIANPRELEMKVRESLWLFEPPKPPPTKPPLLRRLWQALRGQ